MQDFYVDDRTGEVIIIESAAIWWKPWTWFSTREVALSAHDSLRDKLQKWRYLYHREHTKRRASERLNWTPTDREYQRLCEHIAGGNGHRMQSQHGQTDELYEVEFSGRRFQVRFDPDVECVVTVIKKSQNGQRLGDIDGFDELQEQIG